MAFNRFCDRSWLSLLEDICDLFKFLHQHLQLQLSRHWYMLFFFRLILFSISIYSLMRFCAHILSTCATIFKSLRQNYVGKVRTRPILTTISVCYHRQLHRSQRSLQLTKLQYRYRARLSKILNFCRPLHPWSKISFESKSLSWAWCAGIRKPGKIMKTFNVFSIRYWFYAILCFLPLLQSALAEAILLISKRLALLRVLAQASYLMG